MLRSRPAVREVPIDTTDTMAHMDAIDLSDSRIPESFRKYVIVDERTGCWSWCGPTIGGGSTPSYRHRPALKWLWELMAGREDLLPAGSLHAVPTTCGRKTCLNLYHRLFETAPAHIHLPHRCPTCKEWCQASLDQRATEQPT